MPVSLAALMILSAMAAPTPQDDLPEIEARGTLRVIIHSTILPDVVSTTGEPGFEGEMIQSFANLHRLKLEYVTVPASADRIPALLAGKGDAIVAMNPTESRRRQAAFTSEVFPGGHTALSRKPHAPVETEEALRRARVGAARGTSGAEAMAAAKLPSENTTEFASPEAMMQALHTGKIDAVIVGLGWAFLNMHKDPELETGFMMGPFDGPGWATRKEAVHLHQALEEYIENLRRTATWNRLVVKYYGEVALAVLRKSRSTP
jgi:ABC-type amino acid transport substrate-binding protein